MGCVHRGPVTCTALLTFCRDALCSGFTAAAQHGLYLSVTTNHSVLLQYCQKWRPVQSPLTLPPSQSFHWWLHSVKPGSWCATLIYRRVTRHSSVPGRAGRWSPTASSGTSRPRRLEARHLKHTDKGIARQCSSVAFWSNSTWIEVHEIEFGLVWLVGSQEIRFCNESDHPKQHVPTCNPTQWVYTSSILNCQSFSCQTTIMNNFSLIGAFVPIELHFILSGAHGMPRV